MADRSQPPILPVGTRVVVRVPLPGRPEGEPRPAGAVGRVQRVVEGDPPRYVVALLDGDVARFGRDELDVLKRLQREAIRDLAADDGDALWASVAYRCVIGSRAYGLARDGSDVDRRGFFIPPADLHWSLGGVPEQLEDEAEQVVYWEVEKFLKLALKGNPNVLECLYTPLVEEATPFAERLLQMREAFLSKLVYQTFGGYALSQFKKMEQDVRARGAVNWKHAMHLLRVLLAGVVLLREGRLPVDVGPHRDRLLAIRAGAAPWSEVEAWRRSLQAEFDAAYAATRLPDRPDYERANAYLLDVRREMARRDLERRAAVSAPQPPDPEGGEAGRRRVAPRTNLRSGGGDRA